MFSKGMVVQFIEKHKWAGCLGIITEVKEAYLIIINLLVLATILIYILYLMLTYKW